MIFVATAVYDDAPTHMRRNHKLNDLWLIPKKILDYNRDAT